MLSGSTIPEFVDCVDADTIRVYAPSPLLFLCGGPIDVTIDPAPSLRDAFARNQSAGAFARFSFLIAEELNAFFPRGNYRDILNFENDIAQISELIVLFSESYGSAAELGAFAMVQEISQRLLVVIDDKNYKLDSFITLGPLRMLHNEYGDEAVCVLNLEDVKLQSIKDVSKLDVASFSGLMGSAVSARTAKYREKTTFNSDRPGHLIKLIVGLLQHYGALTVDELSLHLSALGVDRTNADLENFLLCAEFAGWLVKDKRGIKSYYVAKASRDAVEFKFRKDVGKLDKDRWRSDIREFWRKNEPERFRAISAAMGASA